MAGQQIDWSFFSMARHLLTARPVFSRPWPVHPFDYGAGSPLARDLRPDASGRFEVLFGPGQLRRGLDERLRQVTRLQRS